MYVMGKNHIWRGYLVSDSKRFQLTDFDGQSLGLKRLAACRSFLSWAICHLWVSEPETCGWKEVNFWPHSEKPLNPRHGLLGWWIEGLTPPSQSLNHYVHDDQLYIKLVRGCFPYFRTFFFFPPRIPWYIVGWFKSPRYPRSPSFHLKFW